MADFSFLSDTDDSAIDEILSEAADLAAPKQIAAINLSGVSDSVLPNHLESRFRRLKTLPSFPPPTESIDKSAPKIAESPPNTSISDHQNPQSKPRSKSSPSPSPSHSLESSYSWLETKAAGEFGSGRRSGSISPPKSGCVCCSPIIRVSRKKSLRKSRSRGRGVEWKGDLNDDVLEDLRVGSMSRREQERVMRMAAEEETRISREAEKIVKWAKQASARMEDFDDDDDGIGGKW